MREVLSLTVTGRQKTFHTIFLLLVKHQWRGIFSHPPNKTVTDSLACTLMLLSFTRELIHLIDDWVVLCSCQDTWMTSHSLSFYLFHNYFSFFQLCRYNSSDYSGVLRGSRFITHAHKFLVFKIWCYMWSK